MANFKDRPFALIGVNSWGHEAGELAKAMKEHNITWRSFDDSGEINRQWNNPATPSYFVIDHDGKIRHHWVGKPGEKSIEDTIEKLVREAEKAGSNGQIHSAIPDRQVSRR